MTHARPLHARLPEWLARVAAAWLWLAALGVAVLGLAAGAARAQDVLPVPALSGRVIDQTGTLSAAQADALSAKLAAIESKHGSQLVVLLVPTTQPEDIAAYAQRVGEAWKIGRRDVGDGLIVVVAKSDRKVRIEVAKALEGAVPDLAARRIISEIVTPAFRGGDFAGGLNAAVDAIGARIAGEALPEPAQSARDGARGLLHGFDLQDLAIFVFFAVPIIGAVARAILGRKLGAAAAGGVLGAIAWGITASVLIAVIAAVVALVMTALGGLGGGASRRGRGGPVIFGDGGGWSSGGGWGSGGGGGWSSGGGGDFGGGGASGDW